MTKCNCWYSDANLYEFELHTDAFKMLLKKIRVIIIPLLSNLEHRAIEPGATKKNKNSKLVWRCHQLLSGS